MAIPGARPHVLRNKLHMSKYRTVAAGVLALFGGALLVFDRLDNTSRACGIVGVFAMAALWLGINQMVRAARQRIRSIATADLEQRVWRVDERYFDYIGHESAEVKEFKRMVARRELDALARAWPSLQRAFLCMERALGTSGRPLIDEYYGEYTALLKELMYRRRQADPR